jgi:hypothetical protein
MPRIQVVDLDGPETEFPHRREAMRNIRALWGGWLVTRGMDRDIMAYAIEGERFRVCRGPGPLWEAFAATLPGYAELEGRVASTMVPDLPGGR